MDGMSDNTQTEAEQTALARLRAGTHVIVPQMAIDWLNGAGPDENGLWFNNHQAMAEMEAIAEGRDLPAFWWRPVFRAMIKAAQEGK